MNHVVTLRDANQQFSKLLKEVESGETVLITRRGKAIAKISPADDEEAERELARERVRARLASGLRLGGTTVTPEEKQAR